MVILQDLVGALRIDRERSAWSRSQSLDEGLVKLAGEIEECREALRDGHPEALVTELGDALWSLIFALIIAEAEHGMSIEQVAAAAYAKLRTRKPWLFEDGPPLSIEEEAALWARAKTSERSRDG
jgi:XTP/dITP diphosphohydrolase